MNHTLSRQIEKDWVSVEHLNENYKPVLKMVRELIGVVPNCNPILEIWPPGFRTFNLLIPNLLNLPAALLGQGAAKDLVGIAMYASSNAAGCPYCTAHHCSFAIRRGADKSAVLGDRSPAEAAVADLAEAMAVVPHRVTPELVDAAAVFLSKDDLEWIVLAVSLGGFLNKFMDAMGIPLEQDTVDDVQAILRPTGWDPDKHMWSTEDDEALFQEGRTLSSARATRMNVDGSDEIPVDGLGTYLRVFRQAPGAARLGKEWTKGVSGRVGPALLMLEEEVGYAFPFLGALGHHKAVKAIATSLRDGLDPRQSRIGLKTKLLAGLVYCREVDDELLSMETMLLLDTLVPGIDPGLLAAVKRFGDTPTTETEVPWGLSVKESAALLLAKAASGSPAAVSEITVAAVHPALSADEIVEVVVWLALMQSLHRLYTYLEASVLDEEDIPRQSDVGLYGGETGSIGIDRAAG